MPENENPQGNHPEIKFSERPPVEQLVSFLNFSMNMADDFHTRENFLRYSEGATEIDGNPQFIDTGTNNPFIKTPHERIRLRAPDAVRTSSFGFTTIGATDMGDHRWDGATFHVVRPIIINRDENESGKVSSEAEVIEEQSLFDISNVGPETGTEEESRHVPYPDEEDELEDSDERIATDDFSTVRPDRFVIYIERSGEADMCYIAHPSLFRDTFVLEEFDIEIFDKTMDEKIDDALDTLLDQIAAEADSDEANDVAQQSTMTEEDKEIVQLEMEAFALELTYYMRNKTIIHPFRAPSN